MSLSRRRMAFGTAVVAGILGLNGLVFAKTRVDLLHSLDLDKDGTIDLAEARSAASATFTRLDSDHDRTLDLHEIRGRLSARELAAADPDRDGTLTEQEYLALVEQRFNAADLDHDGTLDAKELQMKSGRPLLKLLK